MRLRVLMLVSGAVMEDLRRLRGHEASLIWTWRVTFCEMAGCKQAGDVGRDFFS